MSAAVLDDEHVVVIGKIGAPHGIAGGVRLFSFTEPVTNILDFKSLRIAAPGKDINKLSQWKTINVEKIQQHKNCFVVNFSGVKDRDAASLLTHNEIAVLRSELGDLDEDEFYWDDLLGSKVYNKEGLYLGLLDDFMETGANDVVVIVDGTKEHLVPYTEQFILDIDLDESRIIVDWDPDF